MGFDDCKVTLEKVEKILKVRPLKCLPNVPVLKWTERDCKMKHAEKTWCKGLPGR